MQKTTKTCVLLAGLAIAWASAPANSAILYGTTGVGSAISTLVKIDPVTGAVTTIGSVGFSVNGLTWDASTNTLYGSARNDVGLLKIDTATGAGSLVAGSFDSPASGCSSRNVLLAASSGGSLFGWCDPSSDDLMSIDKVTGKATVVGESGVGTGLHGLAFDNSDTLYMHNFDGSYYTMNTATGLATFQGSTGLTAHHGDFNPDDNFYYGVAGSGVIDVLDLVGGGGLQGTLSTGLGDLHTLAFVDLPEPGSLSAGAGLARHGSKAAQEVLIASVIKKTPLKRGLFWAHARRPQGFNARGS